MPQPHRLQLTGGSWCIPGAAEEGPGVPAAQGRAWPAGAVEGRSEALGAEEPCCWQAAATLLCP